MLGPTNSSAGALAEMGIEARMVTPTMKSSACRTLATSVLWAKSRIRRMMPHSTNICVTARIRIAKMIAPTTLSIPA